MAVRKRSKSEAKYSAILAAAADLFLESGFDGTSMDRVASEAGVSKQTVYSHFSSKEALFAAVIEYKAELYGMAPGIFGLDRDCRENLLLFARKLCEMLCTEEVVKMDRLCSSQASERPDLALLYFKSGPHKVRRLVQDYIGTQAQAGVLNIPDLELATSLYFQLAQPDAISLARWGVSDQNRQDTQAYLEAAVDMFLQFYRR